MFLAAIGICAIGTPTFVQLYSELNSAIIDCKLTPLVLNHRRVNFQALGKIHCSRMACEDVPELGGPVS